MTTRVRRFSVPLLMLCMALLSVDVAAQANCPALSRITHDFDNGARWDLCWESRIRENLVLSDIHYTPPGKEAVRIMGSARLSQLHVAYDDSNVTYNDVTQYGLGGSYLQSLTQADCPDGKLLEIQTRPSLCLWQTQADNGYRTPTQAVRADSINLFSVSQVGAYAYITSWTFYDNGSFQPEVGATGALQRGTDDVTVPFGRVLRGDPEKLWLSHTHNYYWRLDFDIGESATDDYVSELRYVTDALGRRALSNQVFTTEQARRISPAAQQVWRIIDEKTSSGYQLSPERNGHRFERADIEPYTNFDFFVTVGNDCERFASQNARFNPDCLNHVLQFVDGQSVQGADIVVWNRVSFHHVPRSEDQRHMHTHWDGFMITPVNLLAGTSELAGRPNTSPIFASLPNRQSALGTLIHEDTVRAFDADGDMLTYSASGLPIGVGIRPDGHLHGYPLVEGSYLVNVTAYDDQSKSDTSFTWTIGNPSTLATTGSGGLSVPVLLSGAVLTIMFIGAGRFKRPA
ncbi:MAG: hypothetical protein AB8B97_01290 [Granulosicoccus sp.]